VGSGSGTPAPAARPSRSAANDGPLVMRESMCELVYSKDALTESMQGKLKQAFKLPVQDPSKVQMFNPDLRRKSLGISKKPGTWTAAPYATPALMPPSDADEMPGEEEYTYEKLVLWTPPPPVDPPADAVVGEAGTSAVDTAADAEGADVPGAPSAALAAAPAAPAAPPGTTIAVDGFLCRWLREHQREGVQFLFDCCMGLRDYDGEGCILADDMGLGECCWLVERKGEDGGRRGQYETWCVLPVCEKGWSEGKRECELCRPYMGLGDCGSKPLLGGGEVGVTQSAGWAARMWGLVCAGPSLRRGPCRVPGTPHHSHHRRSLAAGVMAASPLKSAGGRGCGGGYCGLRLEMRLGECAGSWTGGRAGVGGSAHYPHCLCSLTTVWRPLRSVGWVDLSGLWGRWGRGRMQCGLGAGRLDPQASGEGEDEWMGDALNATDGEGGASGLGRLECRAGSYRCASHHTG
jgi:hypothetical protein